MANADYLKFDGDWNALCDRCGFKHKASTLKEEWTGFMVCKTCYEPRHPQDFVRGVKDDPSVDWTRSDVCAAIYTDIDGNTYDSDCGADDINGDVSVALVKDTNTTIQTWNAELTEDRVARLDTTNARAGDRFVIYKMVDDGKTLYITSTVLDSGTSV